MYTFTPIERNHVDCSVCRPCKYSIFMGIYTVKPLLMDTAELQTSTIKWTAATVPADLSLNSILLQPFTYNHPASPYNGCQSHPLCTVILINNFHNTDNVF